MVSSRARKGRNLGTRINDLDRRTASAEAKARTPDIDANAVEQRLAALEQNTMALMSSNFRAGQDQGVVIGGGEETPPGVTAAVLRGDIAARDSYYPTPANTAERVALANQRVAWFNTDEGWTESYYTVTGSAGLNVPGLIAGTASGWYPVGPAPYITMNATTATHITPDTYVGGWSTGQQRRGGSTWFSYASGKITAVRAGIYDCYVYTAQQTGSGTANYHLRIMTNAEVQLRHVDGIAFPLNPSLYTRASVEFQNQYIGAGHKVGLYVHSGTLDVHVGGSDDIPGQFTLRYMGPALESD